jgi:signal transduction histidine kinase
VRVDIRVDVAADAFTLEVHDDGIGIAPASERSPKSLGLLGIRERARRLGGSVTIGAAASGGTLVVLRVPLQPEGSPR